MPTHSQIPFVQLDVFSSRPFEGNPLAVFPDARQLSDHQMQAIAREMNLSETTFILPRAPEVERERGIRVRIFTTQEELPFAGHPTLGTAFFIRGSSGATEVTLDLHVGKNVNATAMLDYPAGITLSADAFRKLSADLRTHFKKHTPPITYIRTEDPRPIRRHR